MMPDFGARARHARADDVAPAADDVALAVPFSEIPAIPATWLWPGVIPNRTPVLWVAPGGTGKGLAIAAIIGLVTTGRPFPGQAHGAPPAAVVIVAPEDDVNEDLAFRLRAAGASMALVYCLNYLPDGSRFTLPACLPQLASAIAEIQEGGRRVALVVLDPLLAMCDKPIATATAARAIIEPLQDIAREEGVAMIISHHTTKDSTVIAGSKALTDALRLVWRITRGSGDPSAREMTVWKSNKGSQATVRFRITGDGENVRAAFDSPATAASGPQGRRRARLRQVQRELGAL